MRESDHSKNHMGIPALPFCQLPISAEKPKDARYPKQIKSIGDRLRAKRLDLGVRQKDVASILSVSEDSLLLGERTSEAV